jgi:hypothetical protein
MCGVTGGRYSVTQNHPRCDPTPNLPLIFGYCINYFGHIFVLLNSVHADTKLHQVMYIKSLLGYQGNPSRLLLL